MQSMDASRTAHNAIVGYVCHELRNPLHVLETWFRTLVEQTEVLTATAMKLEGFPEKTSSETAESAMIVADVESALNQMRSTVDDVLDFRQVHWQCDSESECAAFFVKGACAVSVRRFVWYRRKRLLLFLCACSHSPRTLGPLLPLSSNPWPLAPTPLEPKAPFSLSPRAHDGPLLEP